MKKKIFITISVGFLLGLLLALTGKDLSRILAYKIYFLERLFSFVDSEKKRDLIIIETSNILSCFIIVWGGIVLSKLEFSVYTGLGSEKYQKLDKPWDIFYRALSKMDEKFKTPSPVRSCNLYISIIPLLGLFYNALIFFYFETNYYMTHEDLLISLAMPFEFLFLIFSCFLGLSLEKHVEIKERSISTRIPWKFYILFLFVILNFLLIGYIELYYIYGR
ncbi:MAG: hypothetical protein ACE5K4_00830 [Candidatus Hydrothermarchaeota archaeon]